MKNKDAIIRYLKEDAKKINIPESIKPDQIQKKLEACNGNRDDSEDSNINEKKKKRLRYPKLLAVAAGICIVLGVAVMAGLVNRLQKKAGWISSNLTYEEIYASMETIWEKEYDFMSRAEGNAVDMVVEEVAAEVTAENDVDTGADMSDSAKTEGVDFGNTNVQTVGVDEGDVVKNDGRYLYQIVRASDWSGKTDIQIIDTKDGLKELSRIEDVDSIVEFYVWEDVLILIQNKYLQNTVDYEQMEICYKLDDGQNYYHEITFYNLADRTAPKEIKTFTLQGYYTSSRVSDGYLYSFSRFYANPGEGESDYDAYVPKLDGKCLSEDNIFLPDDSQGTSYFVMVSIDLSNPVEFVQTAGIILDSELYYVSGSNIYVTESIRTELENGWNVNKTALLRFSYNRGTFTLEAEGEVNGTFKDTFSMDEYNDHLRVVTTVWEYETQVVTDDRTGQKIGSAIVDERQTNALYILDKDLNLTGKIEGLAEEEQIYSARFMGDMGYFVTFRQTDPLFAVDLTDSSNPKVLSELKVSGFSEYLHFYGKDRLFGLGMEADEETGIQEGMKLSMFDISDPANVQEITRLNLSDYYYSEALYNHHAVLIHPSVNIIGFEAECSDDDGYGKEYLVYSYEDDSFVQKFKLDTNWEDGMYYNSRGTFIGETFYLLCGNGDVYSYDMNTGEALESLNL